MKKTCTQLMTWCWLAILAVALWQPYVNAQLLTEQFEYGATGGNLTTASGAVWSAHSAAGTNAIQYNPASLTLGTYPNAGGRATFGTSGEDVNRAFPAQTSGSVYASFIVNITAAQANGDYFFHLGTTPVASSFFGRVFARSRAGGYELGLAKGGTGGTIAEYDASSPTLAFNTSYLVVLRYNIGTTTNVASHSASIFVFNTDAPATEPSPIVTASTGTGTINDLQFVYIRQGTAANAPTGSIDYIRVGTNWADVTAAPSVVSSINTSVSTLPAFSTELNIASTVQSYTVEGSGLTDDLVISAPANFQVSTSPASGFGSSISIPAATANSVNTIYVRYLPTSGTAHTGNISHTSTGATTVNVAVSGNVSTLTTLARWDFENAAKRVAPNLPYTADAGIASNQDISPINLIGSAVFSGWVQGTGGAGTSAPNANAWDGAAEKAWIIAVSTAGYKDLTLSSRQQGSNTGPRDFKVQYSLDGSSWTDVAGSDIVVTTSFAAGGSLNNISLPVATENRNLVYLRWLRVGTASVNNGTTTAAGTNRIDDIVLRGQALTPEIVVGWDFTDQNTIADSGIPANSASEITTTSTGATTYPAGAGGGSSISRTGWDGGEDSKAWIIEFTTVGYKNLTLSSKQQSSDTGPRDFKVQYSLNGNDWIDVAGTNITVANNFTSGVIDEVVLPSALDNIAVVYLRWVMQSNTSVVGGVVASGGTSRIDDIIVKGIPVPVGTQPTPQIFTSRNSLPPLATLELNAPSPETNYTVRGVNLSDDLVITAPAPFQISLSAGTGFTNQLTISAADAATNFSVFVRYLPVSGTSHTGTIVHSSTGVADVEVSASGQIEAPTPIYTIQGTGLTSPLTGQVVFVRGVVTGDFQQEGTEQNLRGFYMQDIDGDGNPATSDGIFVFDNNFGVDVKPGDVVVVRGTVAEFGTAPDTETQISDVVLVQVIGNRAVPALVDVILPGPAGIRLENYEGMLVRFPQELTVTGNFELGRFGSVTLSNDGRIFQPTQYIDPNDDPASGTNFTTTPENTNVAAIQAQLDLDARRQVILDDGKTIQNPNPIPYIDPAEKTLRLGSTIQNVTGVLSNSFGAYRVHPTVTPSFNYKKRESVPSLNNPDLSIVSANLLNYFNGNGDGTGFPTSRGASDLNEFNRQRAKTIAALKDMAADIYGLIEMENDGTGPLSAIVDLRDGVNQAFGDDRYAIIDDPATGVGTDQIRNAFIYNKYKVEPVGAAQSQNNSVHERFPVAQRFRDLNSGREFIVVVVHMRAKVFSQNQVNANPLNADQGDGQGNNNQRRKDQIAAMLPFFDALTNNGIEPIVIMGDYNAYQEEDPIDKMRANGYINFTEGSYSYQFRNQSGSLDHAMGNQAFSTLLSGAAKWHINSDEPVVLDYNTEFKTQDLYAPDAFASSDHDPVMVGIRSAIEAPGALVAAGAARNAINLQWTDNTMLEEGYIIERSPNGQAGTFVEIARTAAGVTTYRDENLNDFTQYFYQVRAFNSFGFSAYSNVADAFTNLVAPEQIANLSATPGISQVRLDWNANPETNIAFYEIFATANGEEEVKIGESTNTFFTALNLTGARNYRLRVRAVNTEGLRGLFAEVNTTPIIGAPNNLTASSASATVVFLNWTDNALDEDGYYVERAFASNGPFNRIATIQANRTQFQDTNLPDNSLVFYRVQAFNRFGTSAYSNVAEVTTRLIPPVAPINLRARPGSGEVELTWTPNTETNIAYYEIFGFSNNSLQTKFGESTTPQFTVSGLQNGTLYLFRVRAVNTGGLVSAFSNSVQVRPSIVLSNEDLFIDDAIAVYPNPNSGSFTLQIENAATGQYQVSISNITGQEVFRSTFDKTDTRLNTQIELSGVASGMYILRIENKNTTYIRKINIQR